MTTSGRRESAETHRLMIEREIRPQGGTEADRDLGLEQAWHRRLAGVRLSHAGQRLDLRFDGSYAGRFPDGAEAGEWGLTSCVGRVSLILTPTTGEGYGFILTREGGGVGLNGQCHECTAGS